MEVCLTCIPTLKTPRRWAWKLLSFMKKALLYLILLLSCFPQVVKATHTMGADITYTCVSPNQYQVQLTFFRDCAGILPNNPQNLEYRSIACGVSASINLYQVGSAVDVTPICPSQISACQGGSSSFGIQQYTFVGTLNLPTGCSDWLLSWENCCRNFAITTLSAPGNQSTYVTAQLDNTTTPCNNSPIFNNIPTPIVCVNQPVTYNHGVTDPDGDELRFSLADCYEGLSDPVNYAAGYSSTVPLSSSGGVSIDSTTGTITFTPDQVQIGVLCVKVEEYRGGVKIGETTRDMQFSVINCTNAPPVASGVDGDTVEYQADFCVGGSICFDIDMTDPDGDNVFSLWNQGIPGGSFVVVNDGGPNPTGTFCWQPTTADIGSHFFTVTVSDDHCPLTGSATYAFTVNVSATSGSVTASPDQTICQGGSVSLLASSSPVADSVRWTPALGLSDPTVLNPVASPQVTTTYTVLAYLPGGCVTQEDVVVNVSEGPALSISPPSALTCTGTSVTLTAISPTATGYLWSTGATTQSITVTPSTTTTYTVTATDASSCPNTASATVTVSAPGSEQCNVVYVAPGATGVGSQADPASLGSALTLASCTPVVVKMDEGTYTLDTTITSLPANITLEGGFQSSQGWRKSSQAGLTVIHRSALNPLGPVSAPRISAFEVIGSSNFRLQDLTITTADGVLAGTSTYGLHLASCTNYDVVRCQIMPGDAASGSNGTDGTDGQDGNDGSLGGAGDANTDDVPGDGGTGGAGGGSANGAGGAGAQDPFGCCFDGVDGNDGSASTNARSGGGGGGGGSGGEADNDGGRGGRGGGVNNGALQNYCASPFDSQPGIGMGFSPTTAQDGNDGCDGNDGTDGTNGTPGPAGTHSAGYFVPGAAAGNGSDGTGGKGGNGGGGGGGQGCFACFNGSGNGGGGGGGGGEGGEGGSGGFGGGSSYSIYLYNNGAGGNISSCYLEAGTPGPGGVGGTGGTGGTGGDGEFGGAVDILEVGQGGTGGDGGNGGDGGDGGIGATGESYAVYQNGGVMLSLNAADTSLNLSAQPTITMENISCVNTNCQFTGGNGFWDLGPNSDPIAAGIHTNPTTTFTATGREDIYFQTSLYEDFAFIQVGSNPIPEAATSAPMIDGYYRICVGSNTNFTAINGVPGYVYRWDLDTATATWVYEDLIYQNLSSISFNQIDTFDILLQYYTDCCGYTVADTLPLIVEAEPSIALNAPTDLCLGDGPAILTATGGDSYTWTPSTGLSFASDDSVLAQPSSTTTYQVTAYSESGLCYDQTNYTLTVTDLLLSANSTDAGCLPDGTASVSVSNGSGVYNYNWSNGATGANVTGLAPGAYQVVVTDPINGCQDSTTVVINQTASSLEGYVASSNAASCNGLSDGNATVNVNGGTGTIYYNWSTGGNTSSITAGAGSYSVDISDDAGCLTTLNVNITEPSPISMAVQDQTLPDCSNQGSLTVEADGTSGPFTFEWNTTPAQTGATASNLGPGTYQVLITDQDGCQDSLQYTLTGTGAPVDMYPLNVQDATTCGSYDGTITVGAADTANTTFVWDISPAQFGPTLTGVGPGSYSVTATRGTCLDTLYFTLGPICPLDLSYLDLFGWGVNDGIRLGWDGWLADSSSPVYLERKLPEEEFQQLALINWNKKSFIDTLVTPGNAYQYRLTQIRPDGESLHSDAVEILLSEENVNDRLRIYPNPTTGSLWAEVFLAEEGKWKISLVNPMGQIIQENTLILTAGMNKLTIDLKNYPDGVYLLKITPEDGTTFEKGYEQRVIKAH